MPVLKTAVLLSLSLVPATFAGEWEKIRERYDTTFPTYEKRIADIEAKERGIPADRGERANKITKDRVAGIRTSLKEGGKGKTLADTAERASRDARPLADLYREQTEYLDIVMNEWGTDGVERKKLRDAIAILQKNLERVSASLSRAAEATPMRLEDSEVLEKVTRIEASASEASERLRTRALREQAARDREREQREREAAERARGVR